MSFGFAFSLAVELSADHVDGAEGGDDVGDHLALDHARDGGHRVHAGRAAPDAVRAVGAVGHHVETQLAVGPLRREVGLPRGRANTGAVDLASVKRELRDVLDSLQSS